MKKKRKGLSGGASKLRLNKMRIEVRVQTEEELDLVVCSNENEDLVYISIGDSSECVQANIEELKKALRVISTK